MQEEPQTNAVSVSGDSRINSTGMLTVNDLRWYADVFVKSGMFENEIDVAKAAVKIMYGAEMGYSPAMAMQNVNVIKNSISMSGNAIAARIKQTPKYDYKMVEYTAEKCVIEWYERNEKTDEYEKVGVNAYTYEQAKAAKIIFGRNGIKDNWAAHPEDMLFNRCISKGYKKFAPDLFMIPVYTPEELHDADAIDGEVAQPARIQPEAGKTLSQLADKSIAGDKEASEDIDKQLDQLKEEVNTPDADSDSEPEKQPAENKDIKPTVDKAFKARVMNDLELLSKQYGLKPQDRLKLLRDATGKVTPNTLDADQWRAFDDAVQDKAVELADAETANDGK